MLQTAVPPSPPQATVPVGSVFRVGYILSRWEVKLLFRRGHRIDMRDVEDAVGLALAS